MRVQVNQLAIIAIITILLTCFVLTDVFAYSYDIIGLSEEQEQDLSIIDGGNIDGDEFEDILVTDPEFGEDGSERGKVYLFIGKNLDSNQIDLTLADYTFEGQDDFDRLGTLAAFIEDQDGDDFDEIELGSEFDQDSITIYSTDLETTNEDSQDQFVSNNAIIVDLYIGASSDDCSLNPNRNATFNVFSAIFTGLGFWLIGLTVMGVRAKAVKRSFDDRNTPDQ